MTITGNVAKNVLAFTQVVTVDSAGKIGGSLTIFTEILSLDGRLGRDLLIFSKDARISGRIAGGIRAKGDTLDITSTAEVDGPVHFEGNKPPDVSPQAKLKSPVEYQKMEHKPEYSRPRFYDWRVIFIAAIVLFGMVLFLLMPKFTEEAIVVAEGIGVSVGLGVLVLFAVPIAAIIACCTVVGLALGISGFLVWYASLHYSQLVVGALLGKWIIGPTREIWPLIGRMALGYFLLRVAFAVPYIGGGGEVGVLILGVGAVFLGLFPGGPPARAGPRSGSARRVLPPGGTPIKTAVREKRD